MKPDRSKYPLWLKLAVRLPVRARRWLRRKFVVAAYWSEYLVLENRSELHTLIENTNKPDFETFEKKVKEAEKAFGAYDSLFNEMHVTCRFKKFQHERKP